MVPVPNQVWNRNLTVAFFNKSRSALWKIKIIPLVDVKVGEPRWGRVPEGASLIFKELLHTRMAVFSSHVPQLLCHH